MFHSEKKQQQYICPFTTSCITSVETPLRTCIFQHRLSPLLPQELVDEHAHTLLRRIASRMYHLWEYVCDRLSREEVVPAVSVLVTIGFLIAGGYLMAYLV